MAFETLSEIVNAVAKPPPVTLTVGTVKTINEAEMTCTITPEDGGEDIADVPLRIMRYADTVGVSVVPAVGTEAIIAWVGGRRPVVFRVHEWSRIKIMNKDGFGVVFENGKIRFGTRASAIHAVPKGDDLETRISRLEGAYNYHQHGGVAPGGGLTGGPSNLVDGTPNFQSNEVYTA